MQPPPLRRLFALEANVFEIICVPERVEVAFYGSLVENVTGAGEDARSHRLRWNAAVAVDYNFRDHVLLSGSKCATQHNHQRKAEDCSKLEKAGRTN